MKISEFRAGLLDFRTAFRKWGVAKQSAELEALIDALAEFDDLTIADLVKRIKAINHSTSKAQKRLKPLNRAAIEHYLLKLTHAVHSSDEFDRVVEQILADKKQLPTAELKALAHDFAGSAPEKGSRQAIGAFLKARRVEMRRQEGLGAAIDRMFGRH